MNLEQAARQALEALEGGLWDYGPGQDEHDKCNEVITALREALAQPQGEPVAWVNLEAWQSGEYWPDDCFTTIRINDTDTPLYTAPPVVQQEPAKVQSDCTIAATISKTETVAPYMNQWVLRECYYDDEGEVTMHRAPKENK